MPSYMGFQYPLLPWSEVYGKPLLSYPPTGRFVGHSDEPGVPQSSVRPSLHPSVNILVSAQYLDYPLEYFDDTSQLCRTGHDNVSHTKMRALALLLFELSPL